MEYESDSDDVGEDLDMDRLPEEANQDDSDEVRSKSCTVVRSDSNR